MPLTLSNLVAALDEFPRYHAIDVFADDLDELRQRPLPASFQPLDVQGRSFLVFHQGRGFQLDLFPEQGVARLSNGVVPPEVAGAVGGAVAGGLVGAAIDAAGKLKGVGLLGGLVLGLLIGASLGGAADARRVFALAYDRAAGQWKAYDGGLLRWMKDQLAVNTG